MHWPTQPPSKPLTGPKDPPSSTLGRLEARLGVSRRTLFLGTLLPVVALLVVAITLVIAPAERAHDSSSSGRWSRSRPVCRRPPSASTAACSCRACCCSASTPDSRRVLSLFLQVLVIPLAAGSHYRMGNFSRNVATAARDRRRDRRLHRTVLRRGAAQGRHRATRRGDDRLRRPHRPRDLAVLGPRQGPCRRRHPQGAASAASA